MESTTYNIIEEKTSDSYSSFQYNDPLSDGVIRILQLFVITPLHSAVAASGIVTNFFTIIILWKLGIKNGMNVGTLALSCTDFMATSIQFVQCLCYILEYAYPYWTIDMWSLGVILLGWVRYAAYFITMWITALISVERCLCVVIPFKVNTIFTKQKFTLFILGLYSLNSIFLVIVYNAEEFVWDLKLVLGLNDTFTEIRILTVIITGQAANVESIIDSVSSIFLSLLAQLLLIVSTVWMVHALKVSSEVRQNTFKDFFMKKSNSERKLRYAKSSMLSKRERKLVKVAVWLAVVLTLCNLPRYSILAVHYTLPGMKEGILKNLYGLLWDISDFSGTINCSSNFIVYWLLNNKFRKRFRDMCGVNNVD